ncbi:hypothetical protein ACJJIQ_07955 [Microbulbifer sp. ANSA003]|uniref:hypothetical protein n=1 Tax=Microbulbifer sp. ANSA003 TaxID=3243360 RepID=UPI004041BD37
MNQSPNVEPINLLTIQELKKKYPISEDISKFVDSTRRVIEKILLGEDHRLLVIVGLCSIHDPDAAMEYASRLNEKRHLYTDRLEIVMRAYFQKPRSVVGWKGLIFDPELDGSGKKMLDLNSHVSFCCLLTKWDCQLEPSF